MASSDTQRFLLCRAGTRVCALPLPYVVEVMRAMVVTPCAGAPDAVLGLAVVRGEPLPVVDLDRCLGATGAERAARFVTVRVEARRAVLAVHAVIGVRTLAVADGALPPLLDGAGALGVDAIAVADHALLLVLRSAHLVPDAAFAAIEVHAAHGAAG